MNIFLLCVLLLNKLPAHEFKMSVCEIVYQEEESNFEVKFYLFQDDLKEALYGDPLSEKMDSIDVERYIQDHFNFQIGQNIQKLQYQSIQMKVDQVLVTFQTGLLTEKAFNNIQISNDLLLEKFPKQTNMVYFMLNEEDKKVRMMNKEKVMVKFDL